MMLARFCQLSTSSAQAPHHPASRPQVGLGQPGALPLFAYSVTRFYLALFSPLVFFRGRQPGSGILSRCQMAFFLEPRHFGATVAACIRDKEPREIQEIGWFRVPVAG